MQSYRANPANPSKVFNTPASNIFFVNAKAKLAEILKKEAISPIDVNQIKQLFVDVLKHQKGPGTNTHKALQLLAGQIIDEAKKMATTPAKRKILTGILLDLHESRTVYGRTGHGDRCLFGKVLTEASLKEPVLQHVALVIDARAALRPMLTPGKHLNPNVITDMVENVKRNIQKTKDIPALLMLLKYTNDYLLNPIEAHCDSVEHKGKGKSQTSIVDQYPDLAKCVVTKLTTLGRAAGSPTLAQTMQRNPDFFKKSVLGQHVSLLVPQTVLAPPHGIPRLVTGAARNDGLAEGKEPCDEDDAAEYAPESKRGGNTQQRRPQPPVPPAEAPIPPRKERTMATDAHALGKIHLEIYGDILSNLGSDENTDVLDEIKSVNGKMRRPVILDNPLDASAAKKRLKTSLGKKGNLVDIRSRLEKFRDDSGLDLSDKDIKARIKKATINRIDNHTPWVKKEFQVGDPLENVRSVITPANEAANRTVRNTVFESYGTTGVSSQSNLNHKSRAGNNQMTELRMGETVVFSGVRHAIVATRDPEERTAVNRAKAKDLLRSAILQKLKRYGAPAAGNPLDIHLVSVSLVTPDDLRSAGGKYHEKQMLKEQDEALQLLCTMEDNDKNELLSEFKDQAGNAFFADPWPTLKITVSTFNFGVNEGEHWGRANQKAMNETAFESLLDPSALIGNDRSVVGRLKDRIHCLRTMPLLPLNQKNPYELPVLVAALAQYTGGSLLFNCKSGKDRTGLFDVMAKIQMRQMHLAKVGEDQGRVVEESVRYFSRLEAFHQKFSLGTATEKEKEWLLQEQGFNRDMLFNSGNREVQEENTTGWGYKLGGKNTERMFEVVFGITNMTEVHGFSKLFGS